MYIPINNLYKRDAGAPAAPADGETDAAGDPLGISPGVWACIAIAAVLIILLVFWRYKATRFPGKAWTSGKVKCTYCRHPITHTTGAQYKDSAYFMAVRNVGWLDWRGWQYRHWNCTSHAHDKANGPAWRSAQPNDEYASEDRMVTQGGKRVVPASVKYRE